MFIERKIFAGLKKHMAVKQATVITGMRRSGKTTLVKELLKLCGSKNQLYLDLQRLDIRELFAEKNYDNIIMALAERGLNLKERAFIGLDEIQLLPGAVGAIKYLYDNYYLKFIITGSSSFYLKNLFSESLAGRKKIFELFPLDFGEWLAFKGIAHKERDFWQLDFRVSEYERLKFYYEEYIHFGGFPEVVLANTEEQKHDLLNDIISSFINIDIKLLADFRDSRAIYNLVKLLAARAGNKLDYSKLSGITGLSRSTVHDYVDLFEKSYLIKRLQVFTSNSEREIVKVPKIYFYDNGLLNVLAEANSGVQFENAVFTELHHFGDLCYFSLKNGREIDFILNKEIAVEVKETPVLTDEKKLQELCKSLKIKKYRLVGRHASPRFKNYIWSGDIR